MAGGKRSEGLLLRSSPSPRAQAELKLAPRVQSARVGNIKAGGNIDREFPPTAGQAGILGGGLQPGGVLVQRGGTQFTPL